MMSDLEYVVRILDFSQVGMPGESERGIYSAAIGLVNGAAE